MSNQKTIGLIVGSETGLPEAFMEAVNSREEGITAELVELGGTFLNEALRYDLIIDRKSHDIPYYREYLKFAALNGSYVVNNPFMRAVDNKFLGVRLARELGIKSPRAVLLPNKRVDIPVSPQNFRNLEYPMNWSGIIDYVGVPAVLKDALTGGRRISHRVHSVDELIERYDESDTLNVLLQELLESDLNVHCFVVGQEQVLPLFYSLEERCYLANRPFPDHATEQAVVEAARKLCRSYGYDMNMVEFVIHEGEPYLINPTNPAPEITLEMMPADDFYWCVNRLADLAVQRARERAPQMTPFGRSRATS